MLNIFRRPRRHAAPSVDADTLAGAHEHGRDGGSGMVSPSAPFHTDPDAGITPELEHQPIYTAPQGGADLAPILGVQDRPLFGGVRTSPAFGSLREGDAYDGSHVEVKGRPALVQLSAAQLMTPVESPAVPTLRVPPVGDPLGRACANAQAIAGQGQA